MADDTLEGRGMLCPRSPLGKPEIHLNQTRNLFGKRSIPIQSMGFLTVKRYPAFLLIFVGKCMLNIPVPWMVWVLAGSKRFWQRGHLGTVLAQGTHPTCQPTACFFLLLVAFFLRKDLWTCVRGCGGPGVMEVYSFWGNLPKPGWPFPQS